MRQFILSSVLIGSSLIAPLAHAATDSNAAGAPQAPTTETASQQITQRPHDKAGWMIKKLGLSDEQAKQFTDLMAQKQQAKTSIMEQTKANREAFQKELEQPSSDTNKLNELHTQFKTLQAQSEDNHFNAILETKKILNPIQFGKYCAMKESMMRHKGQRYGQTKNRHGHDRGRHAGNDQKKI